MYDKTIFNTTVALGGSFLTYLFGYWDEPLKILLIFMAVDYLTGVLAAVKNKSLNSSIGFKGLRRKAVIFSVLIVAVMLDRLLSNGSWAFRTLTCYFYIANEGISILENAGKCGVPLPQKLVSTLEQLKKKEGTS